jgi:hypothetical protein
MQHILPQQLGNIDSTHFVIMSSSSRVIPINHYFDMALIEKSDLKYDYDWSSKPAGKSRTLTTEGRGKTELFRANSGEDVLSFINEYAEDNNIETAEEATEIEVMMRDRLNETEMTKGEMKAWLDGYFKSKNGS